MATTLEQLQTRLEGLQKALASAVQDLRSGDDRVSYRPISEIKDAIAVVQQQIAAAGGQAVVRSIKLTSSKDL